MAKLSATERRQDIEANAGNMRVHVHALTMLVLRQTPGIITMVEAREEALRLYRKGVRA